MEASNSRTSNVPCDLVTLLAAEPSETSVGSRSESPDTASSEDLCDRDQKTNIHGFDIDPPPSSKLRLPRADLEEDVAELVKKVEAWNSVSVYGRTKESEPLCDNDEKPKYMCMFEDDPLELDWDPEKEDSNGTKERQIERKLAYLLTPYSMPEECWTKMKNSFHSADCIEHLELKSAECKGKGGDGAIARRMAVVTGGKHFHDKTETNDGGCSSDLNPEQFEQLFGDWSVLEREIFDSILARDDVKNMMLGVVDPNALIMVMEHRIWRTDFADGSRGSRVSMLHRDYNPFNAHYNENVEFFHRSEKELGLEDFSFASFFEKQHDYFRKGKQRDALMLTLALPLHAANINHTTTGTRFKERESDRVHSMPSIGGFGVFFRTGCDAPDKEYRRDSNEVKFDFDVPFHAGPSKLERHGEGEPKRFFIQTKTLVMKRDWGRQ